MCILYYREVVHGLHGHLNPDYEIPLTTKIILLNINTILNNNHLDNSKCPYLM